jgi:hypothetical protein
MLEANGERIGQTLGEKSIKGRGSKPAREHDSNWKASSAPSFSPYRL